LRWSKGNKARGGDNTKALRATVGTPPASKGKSIVLLESQCSKPVRFYSDRTTPILGAAQQESAFLL